MHDELYSRVSCAEWGPEQSSEHCSQLCSVCSDKPSETAHAWKAETASKDQSPSNALVQSKRTFQNTLSILSRNPSTLSASAAALASDHDPSPSCEHPAHCEAQQGLRVFSRDCSSSSSNSFAAAAAKAVEGSRESPCHLSAALCHVESAAADDASHACCLKQDDSVGLATDCCMHDSHSSASSEASLGTISASCC